MSTQQTKPLALAYIRVSTADQTEGASLAEQEQALIMAAERGGYRVEVIQEEGAKSGKSLNGRPALKAALERLDRGEAAALYGKRLSRLSRSVADFAQLLDRAKRKGWRVVVLDAEVDTTTASGALLVNILAATAQYEREIIAANTKDGLAQRRREGVRLGRPSTLTSETVARIVAQRAAGASLRAIAETLNTGEVPTAHNGSKWHASTVQKVLAGQDAQGLAA